MAFPKLPPWRDLLSLIALVCLLGIAGEALRAAATRPVRFVDRLDRQQLLDWLCTRDLKGEFSATKLRLARRLAEELRQGNHWPRDLAGLDVHRRAQAEYNLQELARVWLLERADRYAALGEPDRTAFVDEQLDDLMYLPIWPRRDAPELAHAPPNPTLVVQQIDDFTGALEASERQRILQFTGALYLRWLQRGYFVLPGGA